MSVEGQDEGHRSQEELTEAETFQGSRRRLRRLKMMRKWRPSCTESSKMIYHCTKTSSAVNMDITTSSSLGSSSLSSVVVCLLLMFCGWRLSEFSLGYPVHLTHT